MIFGVHKPADQVLSNNVFLITAIGIVLVLQTGCSTVPDASHRKTVQSATAVIPQTAEMEPLFGSADHFITHFNKSIGGGPRKWNTEVHFGGRYSLTMQADIEIDYTKNRITRVIGEPQFFLWEYSRIVPLSNGRSSSDVREVLILGPKEWRRFF